MCALNLPRINIAKQRRKHISLQTKSKIAFSKREKKKKKNEIDKEDIVLHINGKFLAIGLSMLNLLHLPVSLIFKPC